MSEKEAAGFRPDINGLRAWAVGGVLMFHFGIPGFGGGFVGVDVFFVISGYLMTSQIVRALSQPDGPGFSLTGFYLARARRIVPALLVLCVCLLLAGWLVLPAHDLRQLSLHVPLALLFVSNFQFWRESDYFDVASHEKWLLHTWSLAVEWQFYLLLPLLLMGLWYRWPRLRALSLGLGALTVLSYLLSVWGSRIGPAAAFYLLPSRAWEMLLGGLVFLLHAESPKSSPGQWRYLYVGLLLIAGSIILAGLDFGSPWPGWMAAVPALGAAMVIWARNGSSSLTGAWLFQKMGDASYSIYLWHWPVVVALAYLELKGEPWALVVGVMVSFLLGWISFHWVEVPARQVLRRQRPIQASMVAVVSIGSAVAFSSYVFLRDGVTGRLDAAVDAVFAASLDKNPHISKCLMKDEAQVPCTHGGPKLGAIVLGDSHAASLVSTVQAALPDTSQHVLDWTMAGCRPLNGVVYRSRGEVCGRFVRQRLLEAHRLPAGVPMVVLARWSADIYGLEDEDGVRPAFPMVHFGTVYDTVAPAFLAEYRSHMVDTLCEFAADRPVYVLTPVPELKRDVPRAMGRAAMFGGHQRVSISLDEYTNRHRFVLSALAEARDRCGIRLIDAVPMFCPAGRCWGDVEGLPIYYDDDHLSEHGARRLLPLFRSIWNSH